MGFTMGMCCATFKDLQSINQHNKEQLKALLKKFHNPHCCKMTQGKIQSRSRFLKETKGRCSLCLRLLLVSTTAIKIRLLLVSTIYLPERKKVLVYPTLYVFEQTQISSKITSDLRKKQFYKQLLEELASEPTSRVN